MYRNGLKAAWLLGLVGALGACENNENGNNNVNNNVPDPVITVAGAHSVQVGATLALTATTTSGTDSGYTWESADEAVATVSAAGVVTGVAAGETSITVTGVDTDAWAMHAVVVVATTVTPASVHVSGGHAVVVGEVLQLTASTLNGTDGSYTWSSSDTEVATVDANGAVTGVAEGEVYLTATGADTGAMHEHAVVVVPAGTVVPPSITVTGGHSVMVGEDLALTAATANGTDGAYTWDTDDAMVATVSANGVVTGVAEGEVAITVTGDDSGATATYPVVVTAIPVIPVASVKLTGEYAILAGTTTTYTATTLNGTDAAYLFQSSDTAVATVDANTGLVTAVQPGDTVITATGTTTGASDSLGLAVRVTIPQIDEWAGSGHADRTAAAFTYTSALGRSCAKCHTTDGFRDWIGDDGSPENFPWNPTSATAGTQGQTDVAQTAFQVIECRACHNPTAQALDHVYFPSATGTTKTVVSNLGASAKCMTCHQGRESTTTVDAAIATANATQLDSPYAALAFRNVHYFPAAATLYAGKVKGGYQYPEIGGVEKLYDWRFRHVPGYDTCTGCHDPHSLEVKVTECADCHTGVTDLASLRDIRTTSSMTSDYDGDGNTTEGVYYEIEGLRTKLYAAIRAYTDEKALSDLCYTSVAHPYWFIDTNGDGACDAAEAVSANKYVQFTPRLAKATYNYQLSVKDPGNFAHNAKYTIQLLFDSIEDLNTELGTPIDMASAVREDVGHFNGASMVFRDWDDGAAVSSGCSPCHAGSEGLRYWRANTLPLAGVEQANGMDCYTCHENFTDYALLAAPSVRIPVSLVNSTTVSFKDNTTPTALTDHVTNLCATCHAGRNSGVTINMYLATNPASKSFQNVHYLPAAGVLAGSAGKLGYQYPSKTYAGTWKHTGTNYSGQGTASCTFCHEASAENHKFDARETYATATSCNVCHSGSIDDLRAGAYAADYDGDGNTTEGLKAEIAGLAEQLWAQMRTVASAGGNPLCYDAHRHPYFFSDTDGDGVCPASPASYNGKWTDPLLKAAHNLQIWHKEPGAWAHNFKYMGQLLFDSYEDLGGDVTGLTRP
jgi:uncharacterized protein YjdB